MPSYLLNLNEVQMHGLRTAARTAGSSIASCLRTAVDLYLSHLQPCNVVLSGQMLSGYALIVGVRAWYCSGG